MNVIAQIADIVNSKEISNRQESQWKLSNILLPLPKDVKINESPKYGIYANRKFNLTFT